jgi:carboxyl-terminal processing protease
MKDDGLATLVKFLILVLVVAVLTVSAFGLGVTVGSRFPLRNTTSARAERETPPPVAGRNASSSDLIDTALFREVWGLLSKQYYGDLPQGKETTYAAIRGLVGSLGDPHTAFLDPQNAGVFNADIEGHFEGIGARVDLAPGGGVLLTYLFPDQPAQKAGLQVGDVVVAVDGKDVRQMTLMEAISHIRGPQNTTVTLTIDREGQPRQDVAVARARIEIPVVQSKTLGNGKLGYVALSEFSSVASDRLAEALRATLKQNPGGLILDLRGNPGGLLDAAVRIGSYFVPAGNILIERARDGSQQLYPRQGDFLLGSTPLVVLVDSGSASASEIVAGAIQDSGTGVLIGEKTYGKGSVQLPNSLSDGSQLRVTIAHWFTPKDRAIDQVGLTPDYAVHISKADIDAKRDPQLDAAVQYLLGERSGLQTPTPAPTRAPTSAGATPTASPVATSTPGPR